MVLKWRPFRTIRVDLLLKKGADENKVLAYLHKHTQLQNNFNVNLTCLVPTENPEVGAPNRLSLKEVLWHFLHFRLQVITERLINELNALEKRIHVLDGFALIFDALENHSHHSKSDGKADAAQRFEAFSAHPYEGRIGCRADRCHPRVETYVARLNQFGLG